MDHTLNIECLHCGRHCSAMKVLFLLFFSQKVQLGVLPFLFCVLKIARSDLATRPNAIDFGGRAIPNVVGSTSDVPCCPPKPNRIGQVCFIPNLGLQLARSKPVVPLGQLETQVTWQKPHKDLFFFKCVFSPTQRPFFFHNFQLITNLF